MESTVATVLHRLRGGNSSAPRLTWYGPDAERVELSGRVLDNWAAKTSNLLTEELDAETGVRFRMDLPPHWKSAVIALGAWQAGAVLVDGAADLVFSAEAGQEREGSGVRVVVALGALDLAYRGVLAPGDIDYAALVRQFADSFEPFDPPAGNDVAAELDGERITQSGLLEQFARAAEPGARVLVDGGRPLREVLATLLGVWAADGSAVLRHPDVEDTPNLRATERITAG
ncbi:TIGR03089 family protein [Sinomonas susongensis]|uniref:TIGR03089 family protein n=1 Tax=Sinomonas susongensis TaxID=1324851 RepID=UPI001108A1FF|nr:TIGR03089 family protein [Sinomonas susongensis]